MKFTLSIVPPGGGEQDYALELESDHIPQPGEYVFVPDDETGVAVFLVRHVENHFLREQKSDTLPIREVVVESEFVSHPLQSDGHAKSLRRYALKGKIAKEYPESGY